MTTNQVIQLEQVNKWYDDFHVLKDIDLTVERGQKIGLPNLLNLR